MRLTNSGTEATMMALAVSKVCTRRSKILVFAGAYHGGALSFAGSGGKGSEVNVGAPHEYLIATYNDLGSVRALLRRPEDRSDVAAIIVEPMMGSGGAIPASEEFLRGLREVANEVGAVLIFDEIMTSRMHRGGGIQSQLPMAMRPDLTTLGKYLGGGMSFGSSPLSSTEIASLICHRCLWRQEIHHGPLRSPQARCTRSCWDIQQ